MGSSKATIGVNESKDAETLKTALLQNLPQFFGNEAFVSRNIAEAKATWNLRLAQDEYPSD
jgi:hypothetical protein